MLKVVIHVGPPKTGTSALQNWLLQNRLWLQQNGIYYPEHGVDVNGVSSGNVDSLYDRNKERHLIFNPDKLIEVKQQCEKVNCKTLLLSSEFFFQKIPELAEFIPPARFIAYIRHPLEVAESSYNQSVKRHSCKETIALSDKPKSFNLDTLEGYLHRLPEDAFYLRGYGKGVFAGGNLITDFLSIFKMEPLSPEPTEKSDVNSSYTLEALEVKRWFNQFELPVLHRALDQFLQGVQSGTRYYSVIAPDKFQKVNEIYATRVSEFVDRFFIFNGKQLLEHINHYQQRPPVNKHINEKEFYNIVADFLRSIPGPGKALEDDIKMLLETPKEQVDFEPQRLVAFRKALPWSKRLKWRLF